jgi:hypothetical protein
MFMKFGVCSFKKCWTHGVPVKIVQLYLPLYMETYMCFARRSECASNPQALLVTMATVVTLVSMVTRFHSGYVVKYKEI